MFIKKSFSSAVIAALCLCSGGGAFAPRTIVRETRTTALQVSRIPRNDGSGLSYGERSRPYRRNFYTQPDWENHRSRDRFIGNLLSFFKSGVVRQLKNELLLMGFVAGFVWSFNLFLVEGWEDFSGVHHDGLVPFFRALQMPSAFFNLSSPALSLLLGKKHSASRGDDRTWFSNCSSYDINTFSFFSFQDEHCLCSLGRSTKGLGYDCEQLSYDHAPSSCLAS